MCLFKKNKAIPYPTPDEEVINQKEDTEKRTHEDSISDDSSYGV